MSWWGLSRPRTVRRSKTGISLFCWSLVGIALIQAAWILTVPPFRGIDEFDHSFKAASVAAGDWSTSHRPSEHGWGEFVRAPTSLVQAAGPVCETYPYTSADNCRPSGRPQNGMSEVASGVARYNPGYYAVVGTVGEAFDGYTKLYAMRVMSALICALLIAWSITVARSWARSVWPAVSILLSATPVVTYSTIVVAPNGVELGGALLVWVSLLGMARVQRPRDAMRLLVPATVGAVPLVTVRTLGPLWLVLIVLTCALLIPRATRVVLLRSVHLRYASGIIACFAGGAILWSVLAGTNAIPGTDAELGSPWRVVPSQIALWFLQSIAAFPTRTDPAPMLVYATVAVAWLGATAIAWRTADRRSRLVLMAVVGASTVIPLGFLLSTYSSAGTLWQGRYTYPYAMGFLLICGWIVDRHGDGRVLAARAQRIGVAAIGMTAALALVVGQLGVLAHERGHSPLAASGAWSVPPSWAIVCLSTVGVGILVWAMSLAPIGLAPGTFSGREAQGALPDRLELNAPAG